ncbi:MAG: hypothetical protein K0R27_3890 [Xanthobacteraceae bacterium]|jgi:hypothetical protein|nr:hypothetical protein [Xanthobacteraceae bacterium]
MNAKLLLLASVLTVVGGQAYAGPCTERITEIEKTMSTSDAGSGPTKPMASGQSGEVAATPREAPKAGETPETGGTVTMNTAVGDKAASPGDVRAQTQGAPTAAQTAQTGRTGATNAREISEALRTAKDADARGDAQACGRALDEVAKFLKG